MAYVWIAVLLLLGLTIGAIPRLRTSTLRLCLKRHPTSFVARLRPNCQTKVTGKVILNEQHLDAPLDGTRCVCYALTIDDIGTENGVRVADDSESVAFVLEDATGRIRVQPLLFEIIPSKNTVVERKISHARSTPQPLLQYLEGCADKGKHQGILASLRRGLGAYRVRQITVVPNALVTLRGLVSPRHDGNPPNDLMVTCPDDGPLIICCYD